MGLFSWQLGIIPIWVAFWTITFFSILVCIIQLSSCCEESLGLGWQLPLKGVPVLLSEQDEKEGDSLWALMLKCASCKIHKSFHVLNVCLYTITFFSKQNHLERLFASKKNFFKKTCHHCLSMPRTHKWITIEWEWYREKRKTGYVTFCNQKQCTALNRL